MERSDLKQKIYYIKGDAMTKKEQEKIGKHNALIIRHKTEVIGINLD